MSRVPPEVLPLLDSSLGTFEKLEVASYLACAGAPVRRTDLAAALPLDIDSLREVLAELTAAEIIKISGLPEPHVQLGPRAQHADFHTLMVLYTEDRVAVVATLSSNAMRRIRSMAARTFAEAFVLKKKRDGAG